MNTKQIKIFGKDINIEFKYWTMDTRIKDVTYFNIKLFKLMKDMLNIISKYISK